MKTLLSPLKVEDEPFLVTTTIERCPKVMMARELVKNALEAAVQAMPGKQWVEVRSVQISGYMKLALWNTGPGMDPAELRTMTNLAASIGKESICSTRVGDGLPT